MVWVFFLLSQICEDIQSSLTLVSMTMAFLSSMNQLYHAKGETAFHYLKNWAKASNKCLTSNTLFNANEHFCQLPE